MEKSDNRTVYLKRWEIAAAFFFNVLALILVAYYLTGEQNRTCKALNKHKAADLDLVLILTGSSLKEYIKNPEIVFIKYRLELEGNPYYLYKHRKVNTEIKNLRHALANANSNKCK